MTTSPTTKALLTEALAIAAGIRHNADRAISAQADIDAYTEAGLTRMIPATQAIVTEAERLRDEFTAKAKATDNPQMAKALRVYAVTI